jgi:hypothetical protein
MALSLPTWPARAELLTPPALSITPESYTPHAIHAGERIWGEVNCYVDLWVEVLHALGCDPVAMLGFVLSAGFDDDQWTFIKPEPEDLRALYGLEVYEMNPWRPPPTGVLEHITEQLGLGRLVTVEVDAFFLPDTAGVSYHLEHVKTTIVPAMVDREASRVGYFHGAGYHEATGDDFLGAMRLADAPGTMAPYVELVRLDRLTRRNADELSRISLDLLRAHLARRPQDNPIIGFGERLTRDVAELAGSDIELFHQYAFATARQCGATAELAADLVSWIAARRPEAGEVNAAHADFIEVAQLAKALQFAMARAARGRRADLSGTLERMVAHWSAAMATLDRVLG